MLDANAGLIAASTFPMPENLPALAIGLIVAAYWWRVIRMAYKMRRKTGRAANFMPAEPLGKILRLIWQPVVWIWVGHPLVLAFVVNPTAPCRPLYQMPILQWIGVVLALVAYAYTRICWKRMGKSWRMGIDPNERTDLVFTGPYAYVRHPIYALSTLMMIGALAAVPTPLMFAAGAVHLLLLQWEARREEDHLTQIHGDQYMRYCENVGRFFPKNLRAYANSGTRILSQ